jgi:type I restriction enzyme S subunit
MVCKTKLKDTEIGRIPQEWDVDSLAEHIELIGGGTPKTTVAEYWNGEIPWISVVDFVGDKRWIHKTEKHITQAGLENSSTKLLHQGQLIISARGTVGELGQVTRDMAFNQSCYGIDGREDLNNDYLYYLLKQKVSEFKQKGHGAVFNTITRDTFKQINIPLPELSEQTSIAKVLADLDAKIEVNQEMNKTLETVGQALFKHWFVDFEFPNEKGESYKSSGGKMVDSELGKIPEGWHVGNLIDMTEIIMGQSPPGESYNETGDGMPFYQGNRDFGFRYPSNRVFCDAPTRIAKEGDVLLSVRAPVGELNIAIEECAIGRGVCAIRMRNFSNSFLLYFLKLKTDLWNNFNSEGTVFGCLNKTELHKIKMVVPLETSLKAYDKIVVPIENHILNNEMQNRQLLQIRDSLLPRLMSGKIRVEVN